MYKYAIIIGKLNLPMVKCYSVQMYLNIIVVG